MREYEISVYIVTFNRVGRLSRCINSVLSQEYPDFEVVVVDNGSSDGSDLLLRSYNDSHRNFRYILLGENKGACYARNVAIRNAVGKYIAGIDDDDEWLPSRLKEMLSAYRDELAFVYSDDQFVFPDGKKKTTRKPRMIDFRHIGYQNDVGNQIFSSREKFISAGLFDENLCAAQDYDMWFRMLEKFSVAKKVNLVGQNIYLGGSDRITASAQKKHGYLSFYRKHKHKMSISQKKHQLLTMKYICQDSISLKMYFRLFSFHFLKRKISIFIKRVLMRSSYSY